MVKKLIEKYYLKIFRAIQKEKIKDKGARVEKFLWWKWNVIRKGKINGIEI